VEEFMEQVAQIKFMVALLIAGLCGPHACMAASSVNPEQPQIFAGLKSDTRQLF
jgi:hypothetical protein